MKQRKERICPVWVGYFLLNPLRKFQQHPDKITGQYLEPGMRVMDFGCAMGYFSIPMARKVGKTGIVYCVDIQKKMLERLMKRAEKRNIHQIIRPVLVNIGDHYINLPDNLDFVLLFAVVHEVPDEEMLFEAISKRLKDEGKILFAEPSGHVQTDDFEHSLYYAGKAGLHIVKELKISGSHAVLLSK
jgi:2-polyprenyl-3-methyl-5-hydroxy-6-metoxy-1,4-benzoquinol methylase